MGRPSKLLIFASLTLVGGVAAAQQGMIVEPWRKAAAAPAVAFPRAMPASGLGGGPPAPASPAVRRPEPLAAAAAVVQKWSPPVIELLVDPWAKVQVAAPVARPRWVARTVEIVDPWPESLAQQPPRVASRPAGAPQSTIF